MMYHPQYAPEYNQQVPQRGYQGEHVVPADNYYDEDDENLDAIEQELNKNFPSYEDDMLDALDEIEDTLPISKQQSGPYVPEAAVPTQNGKLSQFAGEFWFPECRNCPCCKGFKHGCECCKSGVDTCTNESCIDGVFKTQVTEELASRSNDVAVSTETSNATGETSPVTPSVQTTLAVNSSTSYGGYNIQPPSPTAVAPTVPRVSASSITFCKFEMSPTGCRFGAACHFKHMRPPNSLPPTPVYSTGYPLNAMNGPQKCIYFARGNCNVGDSCRFAHY